MGNNFQLSFTARLLHRQVLRLQRRLTVFNYLLKSYPVQNCSRWNLTKKTKKFAANVFQKLFAFRANVGIWNTG
jgi:phage pi2 protein 07